MRNSLSTAKYFTTQIARGPVVWTSIAVALVIALMWPTARSVVDIWSSSQTFTHGYFVFPVFTWLVWRKHQILAQLDARPEWRVLPLISFFGACWLLSNLAGIQVGEHAALALIIMTTIWASVGNTIARAIMFPIVFLFFLAPVGEELVPYLMELTADVTVWAIRNTGIPIYREGLFFSLPSGNWSVVEACSGINYLISSVSLGSLYAYLSYSSYKIRTIFIVIATILPIVANSVRAYIIVMLGHFSGNKIATGVDHLIYGWFFFGIVMFLLFSIGGLFQDTANPEHNDKTKPKQGSLNTYFDSDSRAGFRKFSLVLAGAVLAVGVWPAWTVLISSDDSGLQNTITDSNHLLPHSVQSQEQIKSTTALWQPRMSGFDARLDATYRTNEQAVRAMAFVYVTQRQGKEMINSSNTLIRSQNEEWRTSGSDSRNIALESGTSLEVTETVLLSGANTLVVWQWYRVGQTQTNSRLKVKLLEMLGKLTLKKLPSTAYLIATENSPAAQSALTQAVVTILSE